MTRFAIPDRAKAVAFTLAAAVLPACASADTMDGDRADTALEAMDVELGKQSLAFNGDECPGTGADSALAGDSTTSADEWYDHASCPHQYVVTKQLSGSRGVTVEAAYAGYAGGEFPCSASWVQLAVWKRRITVPANRGWSKVAQTDLVQGTDPPAAAPEGTDPACKARVVISLPDDPRTLEYQVVAQAGWATTYNRVTVSFSPRSVASR